METIIVSLAGSFFLIAVEGIDIIAKSVPHGAGVRRSYNTHVPASKIHLQKVTALDAQGGASA
jgi:hypothetical protein